MCASLAVQNQNYQSKRDNDRNSGKITAGEHYSTEQLQAMLNKVRE